MPHAVIINLWLTLASVGAFFNLLTHTHTHKNTQFHVQNEK